MTNPITAQVSDFLLRQGLYLKVPPVPDKVKFGLALFDSAYSLNCYCNTCNADSVFRHLSRKEREGSYIIYDNEQSQFENTYYDKIINVELFCTHAHCKQKLIYFIKNNNEFFMKIGQFPSIADIQKGSLQRYKKALHHPYDEYLTKAIGLHSHGVGIGSYVYLRRIFEQLIFEEYEKSKTAGDSIPEDFVTLRMDEKITCLKHRLPEFLVDHKVMYSLLSKGIHELEEDECLKFFTALKQGIIEILEERRQKAESEERRASASKELQQFQQWNKKS